MGNVRLSYSDLDKSGDIDKETEIIEENNYYPFGLKHRGYNQIVNAETEHKSRFNSTEYDDDFDLNWYNMPLRHQDPTTGRWNGIDPVTHFSSSTYAGYNNNPVYFADPSGACAFCDWFQGLLGRQPNGLVGGGYRGGASSSLGSFFGNLFSSKISKGLKELSTSKSVYDGGNKLSIGWYRTKNRKGDKVIKFKLLPQGDNFAVNVINNIENGIRDTWNQGMEGKTLSDMSMDGMLAMADLVDDVLAGDGTQEDFEALAAGIIFARVSKGRGAGRGYRVANKSKGHIFAKQKGTINTPKRGHVRPQQETSRNRYVEIFETVANYGQENPNVLSNTQRRMPHMFKGYSYTSPNGTQIWVQTKNGNTIFNAGVNKAPK